jgi:hypothetical protein
MTSMGRGWPLAAGKRRLTGQSFWTCLPAPAPRQECHGHVQRCNPTPCFGARMFQALLCSWRPWAPGRPRREDHQSAFSTPWLGRSLLASLVYPLAPEAMAGTRLLLLSTLCAVLRRTPMDVLQS